MHTDVCAGQRGCGSTPRQNGGSAQGIAITIPPNLGPQGGGGR